MRTTRRQTLSLLGGLLALPAVAALPGASAGRGGEEAELAAFLDAVRAGDLPRVRAALERRPALASARDVAGRSAYVLAWLHDQPEVAGVLRDTGLELDLVEAVLGDDWERFKALAARHPEQLHEAHPVGGTPLYAAALTGSVGLWRLRSAGCASDAIPAGGSGFSPARGAMQALRVEWANSALCDLAGNGADVNLPQAHGSSVLHGAVERRDAALVALAIRKGADVHAVDERGRDPATLARELGWDAGAALLARHAELPRDHRASRFALDARRRPIVRPDMSGLPRALQGEVTGSSHMNLPRVRELVGRDPRLVFSISSDDELAIEASAHLGSRDIIRYHLDHGAPLSLPTAVSLGDVDSVRFWLDRDPLLIHERGAHDFPVMWFAVFGGGSVEMAELLVARGVSPDQTSRGTTALHWCVKRGDADFAAWLLEHGADPEPLAFSWTRAGETPLDLALAQGDGRMQDVLRAGGARR